MSASPTLAILTQAADGFWQRRYLIQLLVMRWQAMGVRVVVTTDADPFVPADVAILHVDLSVVPDSCAQLAERYPRVINGAARDIRKRRYSQLLVERDGPESGPLVVKTDLNSGGWREFRRSALESPLGPLLGRLGSDPVKNRALRWLESKRSWRTKRVLPLDYPVYATRAAVPKGVWDNPNLVVERFVAERDGERYCCRHWLFLGSREVQRRTLSSVPIVRFRSETTPLFEPVPGELREIRAQLGFDYGKFDYGLVDGRVFLYDANRTVGAAADPRKHEETLAVLAPGIAEFIVRN